MDYYLLGIFCGVFVALAVFFIAWAKYRKSHPNAGQYDERQIIGRGKAFQAGFFTLLIAGAVCNVWDFVSSLPGGSFLWNIGTMLLGVTVFAVTAIHYDAYLGLYETPKRFLLMGVCFILAMGLGAISNLMGDRPSQHQIGIMNLEVGLVWVIIVAALLLHRRGVKEAEEE